MAKTLGSKHKNDLDPYNGRRGKPYIKKIMFSKLPYFPLMSFLEFQESLWEQLLADRHDEGAGEARRLAGNPQG